MSNTGLHIVLAGATRITSSSIVIASKVKAEDPIFDKIYKEIVGPQLGARIERYIGAHKDADIGAEEMSFLIKEIPALGPTQEIKSFVGKWNGGADFIDINKLVPDTGMTAPAPLESVVANGIPKALFQKLTKVNFSLNRERFRPFLHKIDLVIFDDVKNPSSWGIENDHRRSLSEKIPVNLQDEDIILISDVDEIPRKEAISKLKNLQEKDFPLTLCYNMYSGSFYNKVIEPANHLQNDSTVALKFGQYKQKPDPQFYRDERSVKYPRIHDAGWHFTSMGGPKNVRKKILSFAHDEYRNSDLDFSENALAERIKNGMKKSLCLYE